MATLLLAVGHSEPAAAAAPISTGAVAAYTYGNDAAPVGLSTSVSERGPPTFAYDYSGRSLAVDTTSHGTSTRPQPVTARAYATSYDHGTRSAQLDNGRATTGTAAGVMTDLRVPSGAMVAAKSADEAADIGHAGLRHQFPNTLKGKSQFYDDVNLGELASRTKGMDGFLQANGNSRYVLRNPGGVDRTTGLPTDVLTVIRRPDGSVVTMFPGTSPKG